MTIQITSEKETSKFDFQRFCRECGLLYPDKERVGSFPATNSGLLVAGNRVWEPNKVVRPVTIT